MDVESLILPIDCEFVIELHGSILGTICNQKMQSKNAITLCNFWDDNVLMYFPAD